MTCIDCVLYMHFQSKKNIVIAGTDTDLVGFERMVDNEVISNLANSNDNDAKYDSDFVWTNTCVLGSHYVERYAGLWIDYDQDDITLTMTVGDEYTAIVWSQLDYNNCVTDKAPKTFADAVQLAAPSTYFMQ